MTCGHALCCHSLDFDADTFLNKFPEFKNLPKSRDFAGQELITVAVGSGRKYSVRSAKKKSTASHVHFNIDAVVHAFSPPSRVTDLHLVFRNKLCMHLAWAPPLEWGGCNID
eukprot:1815832-Prymnesium_polylepis.1